MKIPRAYVITLPEKKQLAAKRARHFAERGLTDYRFYSGMYAEMLGVRTVWTYDVDNPGTNVYLGMKQVGIWLSHFSLWAALMLIEGEEHFLIMEDDALLPADWRERVEEALGQTPADFDMLYLGSCCCVGHPMNHIGGKIYQLTGGHGPQCLHAYVVARKALPVMIETQKRLYAPIDCSLVFHSHPHLKVYVVLPAIIHQDGTEVPP